jgi:FtsH-binding integral membrane protein
MDTTRTRAEVVNAFMRGVYAWMCMGLGVTALAALFTISTPAVPGGPGQPDRVYSG